MRRPAQPKASASTRRYYICEAGRNPLGSGLKNTFPAGLDVIQEVAMSLTILFGLYFFQLTGGVTSASNMERQLGVWQAQEKADEETCQREKRQATYEEKQFITKFNHLVGVLEEFAKQYNQGHTLDLKKVKAVRKAWRELEKSDVWFRSDER
jgi:hypothetical protein